MLTEEKKAPHPYKCDECSKSRGRPVVFTCRKDLRRHLRTTLIHNALPVARCSCGTTVTRKDAMHSHRRYCQGTTVFLDEANAEGRGQGSMALRDGASVGIESGVGGAFGRPFYMQL